MKERIGVVGIGCTALRALSPDVNYREMIYEAATKAYEDCALEPRDIGTFVSCTEDYHEGTSISDEYVPDQIGAVLKPVQTICGDALTGLASAFLQIRTGLFDVALVESHSKASNVCHFSHIEAFAQDPVSVRPLALNTKFVAGLEARCFLQRRGYTSTDTAKVVVKNRRNALKNPLAAFPAVLDDRVVLASAPVAEPLTELDCAAPADGAVVVILARESVARRLRVKPIWIDGIGFAQDTPDLDQREWDRAVYATISAQMAYRMAGISSPGNQIDFAEVDDAFSYKELQHLEAVGLVPEGQVGSLLANGSFLPSGALPVNVSGGSLGGGHLLDASGLRSLAEAVWQLRGEAGQHQLPGVEVGLVQSWRGLPTAAGAVAVLSNR